MKEYALSDKQCRSRMLLRYFGEHTALPCQQCDNCRAQRGAALPETAYFAYLDFVADLLADCQAHPVEELHTLPIPTEHLRPFLARLMSEDSLTLCDGMIMKRG